MDSDVEECCWNSTPMTIERKGKKTVSLGQRAFFEAGMRSATKSQRSHLEKVAAALETSRYCNYK